MKKLKLYEDFLNESDAYTISRLANDIGLGPAQDFLDSHSVNIELLKKDISQGTINKYDLRDIIRGNAPSSKIKKFIKTYVNESAVTESVFAFKPDNIEQLHFETDPKTAEKMKIELGKMHGEVSKRKQIESGEYSLRRFRKEIGYGNGKDVGVFLPGSYAAAISELGDGPHKKAVKAIKWNQKKYDQWLEDMASNGGAENAFDMAQNAEFEPGLIDWVKKNFRGDDPLQRIQWDIEAFAESVVTEAKTLTRDVLMNLLETKYKIKTVRTSEEFNGQTEGIWMAADNEEELSGNKIFDYYNRSAKYTNGILKQVKTAVEKTGWWFEWQDPGTIIIWPKNLAESSVTELKQHLVSGTSGRTIMTLDNRKYELKKPVKGVKIGSFTNQTLPKGTIIHNLPGGVFAMHRELEDKFKLTYSSQAPRWNHTFGVLVTSLSDTLEAIESNSKILESNYSGNIAGDAAEYIAKELSQYVKGIISQSNDKVTYFHLKDKSKKGLVIKMLMDLYGIDAQDGRTQFSPSPTVKFDNDQIVESTGHSSQLGKINESEIIYNQFDFEGMWAQKLGMTREEYVAHFATMTAGVDEAKLKDIKGKQFEVKGANFTYVEQTGRFYGVYLYDVAKTSNVADRLKLSSMSDANEFLALHGITEQLPYRYDEKELDVICKKLAKQGIVCDHNDNFDVS